MTWQAIASCNPALRTCLTIAEAQFPPAFQHRILKKPLPMGLAGEKPHGIMAPHLVYQENENELSTLSIHIHPALIDESSYEKLKDDFLLFYYGYAMPFRLPFEVYIRNVHARNQDEASRYWLQEFDSFRHKPLFGTSTVADDRDIVLSIVNTPPDLASRLSAFEYEYQGLSEPMLLAAWGIVISQHLDIEDVAFNTTLRDDLMEGGDSIISYLEVNVPIRINIKPDEPIQELLHRVKQVSDSAKRFGYIGSRKIETTCPNLKDVQTSIRFTSGVRTARSEHRVSSKVEVEVDLTSAQVFITHPSTIKKTVVKLTIGHLLEALNTMLLHPEDLVQDINIASPAEVDQLLAWGQAKRTVTPKLVQELIENQCKISPDGSAVHFLDQQPTTYSQLNSMANRVARQLHEMIKPGTTVAVHMEMSLKFVVALLAILKAGGAYVIVDPEHPTDRKKFVLANSLAKVCVVANRDHGQITEMDLDLSVLSIDVLLDVSKDDRDLDLAIDVESPAYIIYTSGSTGVPKGVVLSHRAVSSGISCAADLPSFRTLLFYNPVFSAAQRTILSTLAHGGCLCLASGPHLRHRLAETINSLQVNNLGITSSTITLLDPESVPTLSLVTVTGESPNSDLVGKWAGLVELRNNYGLSECTQLNWGTILSEANPTSRAIGFATDTTSAYVLRRNDTSLAPFMVPGELCLTGPQLANGYLGRADLTASAFVSHPFSPGQKLYRTGDLAVRRHDGSIEILGRKDSQVKINGQRVEPREVEAVCLPESRVSTLLHFLWHHRCHFSLHMLYT